MTLLDEPTTAETAGTPYGKAFFDRQQAESSPSARAIVPIVMQLVEPASVVDVGCGIGAWLRTFADHGVTDVLGIDGDYVDRSALMIDRAAFRPADLARPERLSRQFDLAVCIEVAEHLPPSSADALVDVLAAAAPCVLFSAAAPEQGGTAHVNERWPGYWADKFRVHGFERLDPIRPRVWRDPDVEWWFKQNLCLYCHRDAIAANPRLRVEADLAARFPFELVYRPLFDALAERAKDRLATKVWRKLRQLARRTRPAH